MAEKLDSWIELQSKINPKTGKTEKNKVRKNPNLSTEFHESWITKGADKSLNDFARKAGEYMAPLDEWDKDYLSSSQIRNVYGEIKRIQMKGLKDDASRSSFFLMRAKIAYASGRNKSKGMFLFEKIFDNGWTLVNGDNQKFQNFCNLIEAILAYHKSFGGN